MEILYEDNHLIIINKRAGELVQPDPSGAPALEQQVKEWIKTRDGKPGEAFLGVVHRIDRPVSGAVLFAKTSKALARLNELIKERKIGKIYWAIVEKAPAEPAGELVHHIVRNGKNNTSKAHDTPQKDSKEARLKYCLIGSSDRYHLLEIELLTGRHHQIRAQLAKIGSPIKGDLKYGAARSNPDGGISLHARRLYFEHPVGERRMVDVVAPVPAEKLWQFFATLPSLSS